MVSGFFLGGAGAGFSQGFTSGFNTVDNALYRQGVLQLEQKRLAQDEQNKQRAQYLQLYSTGVDHLSETMSQLRIAHPDWTDMQLASNPAVISMKNMLGQYGKNLGLPDNIDSVVANFAARPSAFDALNSGRPSRTAPKSSAAVNSVNPDLDQSEALGSRNQPATFNQRYAGDDVDRLTRALALTGDNSGLRAALAARLGQALKQTGDDTQVHVLKDDGGNEHVVFIDPRKRTVTDSNGNPYVAPTGAGDDVKEIVGAIKAGKQPPVTTGLYKDAKKVRAEAAREGLDLSQMQLEWDAARKQVISLNGPQQIRYIGLAKSVINTIDEANRVADEMQNTGVPLYNKLRLEKYIQTEGNSDKGRLAARYLAVTGTLKEEFANLANGGYAPTEPAWALANKQVNGDYGVLEFKDSLTEVQRLLNYRLKNIPNIDTLGPGASNRYVGGGKGNSEQPATPSVDVKTLSDDQLKAIIGAH